MIADFLRIYIFELFIVSVFLFIVNAVWVALFSPV